MNNETNISLNAHDFNLIASALRGFADTCKVIRTSINAPAPGTKNSALRDVENTLAKVLAIAADRDYRNAPAIREALAIIVANATIQPDASMGGATDCYAVPLDDIERAAAALFE